MGRAVVVSAMSADVHHLTFDPDARRGLKSSADELLGALWTGYTHASEFYRANPTTERWRTLVRAHALYQVAFMAEEGKVQP